MVVLRYLSRDDFRVLTAVSSELRVITFSDSELASMICRVSSAVVRSSITLSARSLTDSWCN